MQQRARQACGTALTTAATTLPKYIDTILLISFAVSSAKKDVLELDMAAVRFPFHLEKQFSFFFFSIFILYILFYFPFLEGREVVGGGEW